MEVLRRQVTTAMRVVEDLLWVVALGLFALCLLRIVALAVLWLLAPVLALALGLGLLALYQYALALTALPLGRDRATR